ncbi:phosphate signaling complex protein PhoU [uncultured Clostridium sp.]|uniref:phosphate signaling complex protein PhoU n=1 Tax=uncultured Clostridium sp. TaxID=59620 RepID=UPI00262EC387|nr:phosphate signaling complex protein PhoU [uncultured Clostridium sp.]
MTRETHNAKINDINKKILRMSNGFIEQFEMSMEALKNNDLELAKKAIDYDDKIDYLQKEIEEECIKFIATEQPLAKDLRRVFTASKIVTDIERMSDHTVDVCKIAISNKRNSYIDEAKKLWLMQEKIIQMTRLAIKAYIDRDFEFAYKICRLDDEIDAMYNEVFDNVLALIKKDDSKISLGTKLMFVSKYLERMGDHITNICEWIIFIKNGEYVDLND